MMEKLRSAGWKIADLLQRKIGGLVRSGHSLVGCSKILGQRDADQEDAVNY